MPEKNNRNQRPAAPPETKQLDPYWMIQNAESLQRVAKHLGENSFESSELDPVLFTGTVLASPILLTLAVEIALKAWLCQEQKKDPPLTHDLLDLLNALEPSTRKTLEAQMPGWTMFRWDFQRELLTRTNRCLSFCGAVGFRINRAARATPMRTLTGDTSTKNTGVRVALGSSTRHSR